MTDLAAYRRFVNEKLTLAARRGVQCDPNQINPILTRGTSYNHGLPNAPGRGFGIWLGILGALEIPYRTVRPSQWTKRIFSGLPGKGKERSVQFARRMFPALELVPPGCRKPRDGRADAACLAYYGVVA